MELMRAFAGNLAKKKKTNSGFVGYPVASRRGQTVGKRRYFSTKKGPPDRNAPSVEKAGMNRRGRTS